MTYEKVMESIYKGKEQYLPERLLCLDPGHETGWALFEKGKLVDQGQCITVSAVNGELKIHWNVLDELFTKQNPTFVICENYRIYAHKLDRHSFSQVETLRLIGGIDMLCHFDGIPIDYQMAVQAKGFVTDDRLKDWGFWKQGMRHSRDAIRHGLYWLIINNKKNIK